MKRRFAGMLFAVTSAVIVVAMAGPASAAPIQDFHLVSNNGVRVAVAQGIVANGTGTFVSTGPTSETIQIGSASPIFLTRTVGSQTATLDAGTCRVTVAEKGTFEYSQHSGDATFGGSGPYTLSGIRTGHRVGSGCAFSSPALSSYAINATSTEAHAVA